MKRKDAKTQRKAQRRIEAAFGGTKSGVAAFATPLRLCVFAVNPTLVPDSAL
jgi:hypothetical protein